LTGQAFVSTNGAMPLDYAQSGVKYDALDAFKRACQREAATTVAALAPHGVAEPAGIRGESAYLLETPTEFLAHVEEGLGSKNLVADAMLKLTGRSFYRNIGIDVVATIVNDLVTVGALPISVAMHAAVGDAAWFEHQERSADLAAGFAEGCRQAGAVWGGGETPALNGIVEPGTAVLAGSALGRITPKSHRILGDIQEGDAIILVASRGVHTNGLTLCRALAEQLPDGYLSRLEGGRTFGEALLDPSMIYVNLIASLQRAGLRIHYAAHITGHGWRKLMRADVPFVYRIDQLPPPSDLFRFIAQAGPVEPREMYATFNMGAGFALYVDPSHETAVLAEAGRAGYDAWRAGTVLRQGSRKAVEIVPVDMAFEAETLRVR
jgi:phosphoribosylformylglycinamidine cyclo-ligase